jgi:alanyl-tRNA synthetase
VNERIRQNIDLLEERDVPIEEARNRGAMMLFGEKYGDKVRMITFDKEFSMELCAGTHAEATGELGFFRLISETSVAAGIRRVEGVVSKKAEAILQEESNILHEVQRELGNPKDVIGALQKVLQEKHQLEKELSDVQSRQLLLQLDAVLQNGQKINLSNGDYSLYAGKLDGADMEGLKKAGYEALNRAGNESAIVLVSPESTTGKVYVLAALSQDLVDAGYHAGKWVKDLAQIVGGGGGGQPTLATAGGRDASRIIELLEKSAELLQKQ